MAAPRRSEHQNELFAQPAPVATIYTVTQFTLEMRDALRRQFPQRIGVSGEISNFKKHTNGHCYFTLKDDRSELPCVMWRSAATHLKFQPQDGLAVTAWGEIDLYERQGKYQLYVQRLQPSGTGALELAFRQLYEKLRQEGLFDPGRKRPLPPYPQHIAVLTSPTGAVIQDIIQTLRRRYPPALVSILPIMVQGPQAVAQIVEALKKINTLIVPGDPVELIILARGGGSLEDLWAFNEEPVVRAIHQSRLPVVSAIGHEVDITLSDLVADLRAATPTAAAEMIAPHRDEIAHRLNQRQHHLHQLLQHKLNQSRQRLDHLAERDLTRQWWNTQQRRYHQVQQLASRERQSLMIQLHRGRIRLENFHRALQALEPHRYLTTRRERLYQLEQRLTTSVRQNSQKRHKIIMTLQHRFDTHHPRQLLQHHQWQWRTTSQDISRAILQLGEKQRLRLDHLHDKLQATSYKRTLQRGYSVTRRASDEKLIRKLDDLAEGELIRTELVDGRLDSIVKEIIPGISEGEND
ncbi:MAG: Exodeoxyribonuclease 7 large subunit [Phycisphaerae bacterium]|nr:Exodeoxyribonuclease 7 large subunit [Phycisphaerae bacterium]